jgi:proteasome lid subunit RPN8/RPN11
VTALAIPAPLRAQLYAHALAMFPDEACGYLTGPRDGAEVDAIVPCRNAQPDGEHPLTPERGADTGFVIAGAELLAFARTFDSPTPARIVYHSHTNGRAYLSEVDRQMALGSGYPVQHLVIGVTVHAVTDVAQFDRDLVEVARWKP